MDEQGLKPQVILLGDYMLDNTKVAQTALIFLSEHVAPKLGHRVLTLVPERFLLHSVGVYSLLFSSPLPR